MWTCARAFGALVMMRDDAIDAPIPERFEPSDSYKKWLLDERAKLGALVAMSVEEVAAAAEADYLERRAAWARREHLEADEAVKRPAFIAMYGVPARA